MLESGRLVAGEVLGLFANCELYQTNLLLLHWIAEMRTRACVFAALVMGM